MVTKLADGRGQVTLKGHEVTADWEHLIRNAAQRNGQTLADFVVTITTAAAQAILKGESAVPAGVPARPEDVRDVLWEAMAELRNEIHADMARLAQEQAALREQLVADTDVLRAGLADQPDTAQALRREVRRAFRVGGRNRR